MDIFTLTTKDLSRRGRRKVETLIASEYRKHGYLEPDIETVQFEWDDGIILELHPLDELPPPRSVTTTGRRFRNAVVVPHSGETR